MPQDRWINITLDPAAASKRERGKFNNSKGMGGSASGDLTISYDSAKFTSLSVLQAAIDSAIEQAAQSMRP